MRFYDALQMDPAMLKPKLHAAQTAQEKHRLLAALVLRAVLIVLFAVVFIGPLSAVFGSENSPMAVALFCILMGTRFVDFNYRIWDSMVNLAVSFLLLLIAPVLVTMVHPVFAVCIHFIAFFSILCMTCQRPEMGNGGLYSFAYIYLTGNPVTGQLFWQRAQLTLLGYLLCGAILFVKHRHKNPEVSFSQVLSQFDFSQEKYRWQVRMALGVSLVLSLGSFLQVERFMWMGFACGTLLSGYPYTSDVTQRFWQRLVGVVAGSVLFLVVYNLTPESFHTLLGPIGGLCLGFCADYRWKTAMNCLGALMMASAAYGAQGAVLLRIWDNVLGVVFGLVFVWLYQQAVEQYFVHFSSHTKQGALRG